MRPVYYIKNRDLINTNEKAILLEHYILNKTSVLPVYVSIKNRNLINMNQKAVLLEWSHKAIKRLIVYMVSVY